MLERPGSEARDERERGEGFLVLEKPPIQRMKKVL
jgi:hypothetical protein